MKLLIVIVINTVCPILYFLLALRAVLPWIPNSRNSQWARPVYYLINPLVKPVQQAFPPEKVGSDVSAFVVTILIWLAQKIIVFILTGG